MSLRDDIKRKIRLLSSQQSAYQHTFSSASGKAVLADLAPFCRAAETCGVPGDHDKTMILIGRNEVWLHIQQYLNLTPEQLFALYDARTAARAAGEADG